MIKVQSRILKLKVGIAHDKKMHMDTHTKAELQPCH